MRNTQTGQTNTMIAGGLSPEGAGAYGVYLTATTATVERTVSGEAETAAWDLRESMAKALTVRPEVRAAAATISRRGFPSRRIRPISRSSSGTGCAIACSRSSTRRGPTT